MASRKPTLKETMVATCVAVGIVGLHLAFAWLPDLMLGRMPEAVARGLSLFVYVVAFFSLLEFWEHFFHGRKWSDKPFAYAKVILMTALSIILIEVIRALI